MINRRIFQLSTLAMSVPSVHSFTSKKVEKIIALSLPLTGVQAEVGKQIEKGYKLGLLASNSEYRLLVQDDFGEVARCTENIKNFAKNPNILATSCIVGTPHAQAAIPLAVAGGLPVVGIRSGSRLLRDGKAGVFHFRSSYEDELDAMVRMCAGSGIKKVVIIHSKDSFGESAKTHLRKTLANMDVEAMPDIPVARDGSDINTSATQCASFVKNGGTSFGIILLMITKPMIEMAKSLRETHNIGFPIMAMSFTATKSVATEPIPFLKGLGIVTAFPIPSVSNELLSIQYRRNCDNPKYDFNDLRGSLTAYEAYFYAMILCKTGAQSREQLVQKLMLGVKLEDRNIKPDSDNVGYKFLQIVVKSEAGHLRS